MRTRVSIYGICWLALLLLLSACGGQPALAPETTAAVSGALELSVSGMPEGAEASVSVTGPRRYRQEVRESTTLEPLPPGSYQVAADPVTLLGVAYTPAVDPPRAVVRKDRITTVNVSYTRPAPQSAELVVSVSGLPEGLSANATVTGPGDFEASVTSSTRLSDLTPGDYTLSGFSALQNGEVFIPETASVTVAVTERQESSAALTYVQPERLERPESTDWRDEIIYFAMTDRFRNGDPTNDSGAARPGAGDEGTTEAENPLGWHGGDFAGLTQAIREGYFQKMGFTALWLTPVYLQVPALSVNDPGSPNDGERFAGYHGYWAEDFF